LCPRSPAQSEIGDRAHAALYRGLKYRSANLAPGIRLPRREGKADGKGKKTTEEQPKAKEQKTKRELQAMARERLGCAVPVRRDANGGWYFQVIEVAGLNSGTLQRRAKLLAEELRQLYDLKE
jgi:hypothetical protein